MRSRRFSDACKRLFLSLFLLGVQQVVCPAQENSSGASDAAARAAEAEDYLRERLALWQRRLRLEDWSISVVLSRADALRPKTLGNIRWDPDAKTACIRVLDVPGSRKPFSETLKDMEFTLLHELIHLTLSSLPRSETTQSDEEHAINRITGALLRAERGD